MYYIEKMSWMKDPAFTLSLALILFGIALGLPYIELGIFGLDFSEFPTAVITTLRLGIIGLAVAIGLKPLQSKGEDKQWR